MLNKHVIEDHEDALAYVDRLNAFTKTFDQIVDNLIIREKKEGLDTAHKTAYEYSITNNYQYLITMDADLTHNPKKILEHLANRVGIVK